MSLIRLALGALALAFLLPVHAQQCPSDRVVFVINGVLTSSDSALKNLRAARASYINLNPSEPVRPTFRHLHNPSGTRIVRTGPTDLMLAQYFAGATVDFIEVLAQTFGLRFSRAYRISSGQEQLPPELRTSEVAALFGFAGNVLDPATLDRMTTSVDSAISSGSKVVLLAHSQGNLWANSLVATMAPARLTSVGQVGVAVPDTRLERALRPHVTLFDDWVISNLGAILSNWLRWNVTNSYSTAELFSRSAGHDFVSAYLDRGKPSESAVVSAIRQTFPGLVRAPGVLDPCKNVSVTKATCELVTGLSGGLINGQPIVTRRWTIEGVARSAVAGSAIVPSATLVQLPPPGERTVVSSCVSGWTGTQSYANYQAGETATFCAKNPADPELTTWRATVYGANMTNDYSVEARLFEGPTLIFLPAPGVIPVVYEDRRFGLRQCPAVYTFQ